MEIHQLRYFVAVAQEGGFSRAAELAHVAQPSLSQQIQKLEAEMGAPLFDRLARGVSLTEAGNRLLPFARRILSELNDARRCVDECQEDVGGSVAVGIIPTVAPYVVGPLLRALPVRHPGVTVGIREDVTDQLVRALEDGELDMAVVSTCRDASGLHREQVAREPLLMMVPHDHPAAKRQGTVLQILREEPFLTLHESHCLTQQVERWCRQQKLSPKVTPPAMQLSTVVAMVAAGQGVSLLPAMAAAHEQGHGCAFLSLGELTPQREINVLRNPARFQSKAAAAVAALVRQVVSAAVDTGQPGRPSGDHARTKAESSAVNS